MNDDMEELLMSAEKSTTVAKSMFDDNLTMNDDHIDLDNSKNNHVYYPARRMVRFNDRDTDDYLEFFDHYEAVDYAVKHWKSFWFALPEDDLDLIKSFESNGRRSYNRLDVLLIDAAKRAIKIVPPFDDNVVLYRGGKESDFDGNRPFLASSFIKTTADYFAKNTDSNIYTIRVHKGSKTLPICGIGEKGFTLEEEVLLETSRMKISGNMIDYY